MDYPVTFPPPPTSFHYSRLVQLKKNDPILSWSTSTGRNGRYDLNSSLIRSTHKDIEHLKGKGLSTCGGRGGGGGRGGDTFGILNQNVQVLNDELFGNETNQGGIDRPIRFYQGQMGNGIDTKGFNQWPCIGSIGIDHDKIDRGGIRLFDLVQGRCQLFAIFAPNDDERTQSEGVSEWVMMGPEKRQTRHLSTYQGAQKSTMVGLSVVPMTVTGEDCCCICTKRDMGSKG